MATTRVLIDGPDADPLAPGNRIIEAELPGGYYRVWRGALKPGDLYLDVFAARDGVIAWEPVTRFPTEEEAKGDKPWSSARWYDCLIRKGQPVEPPCDRCGVAAREPRLRFCLACAGIALGL